ncbi:UNVERIFIED_CONTAM: hypothetical protein GTU68_058175 [Idotea baltica]|nr:hypothetical protein [Idotea baltica]
MENMAPTRPLTHDLFKNTMDIFDIELKEVIINDLLDGIFYARLVCIANHKEIEIDSRTSDAIALAVRFGCPIFTYKFILEQAGVILETPDDSPVITEGSGKARKPQGYQSYSTEALNKMLEDVLAEEDYEKAALIRDEINRRS